MSLSLLKGELEKACEAEAKLSGKHRGSHGSKLQVGTQRHGLKKKKMKIKSKKTSAEKYSFKFSEQTADIDSSSAKLKATLKKLEVLDKIGENISASHILSDNAKKKRHNKVDATTRMGEKEPKSILLTDEEVAQIEKEYFIHSKSSKNRKEKDDIWDEWRTIAINVK